MERSYLPFDLAGRVRIDDLHAQVEIPAAAAAVVAAIRHDGRSDRRQVPLAVIAAQARTRLRVVEVAAVSRAL